ncbi:MAG: Maf family protein [Kiloniellales bacterium]
MSSLATAETSGVGRPAPGTPPVVLASASPSRAALLRQAGVPVVIELARVDEGEVKTALAAEGADASLAAEALAELKAQKISRRHGSALVIGADQILDCDGVWHDKPEDLDQAARQLRALAGRTHRLVSAVCVVRQGTRIWHRVEEARLTVRPLGDRFIADYLAAVGPAALSSVGAYQLEGLGAQLFARIEGDYFTILGLPLLPLMDVLRNHGVVPT